MAKKGQYTYEYPHPAVTADCVVFGYDGKELRVLLIKRGAEKEASTTAYVGEWALPGGFLDVEQDKTIAHTAQRELKEETGYVGEEWSDLGIIYPSVGSSDEIRHLFLARKLKKEETHLDEEERITCSFIPREKILKLIQNGQLPDAKTQSAIFNYLLKHREKYRDVTNTREG